ncbi:hypothetical protein TIFTF001_023652 [Ficus carica]|uniref:Uncharacterized protein n=1 Tax=Ficus carica TaxID=3494 RepID=A0AA88ALB3_FICCA|nr:hypothetical protein TIFTF001_023652 [Ficus carica]
MGKVQVSPIALPVILLPALLKINPNIPCKSELTPFSAVAPARVLAFSRVQIETSLETIYEEEIFISAIIEGDDDDDDDFVELATTPECHESSSTKTTTCFLELHKSFSSAAFSHCNFQCAN